MKELFRRVVPPVIIHFAREFQHPTPTYPTYEDARNRCGDAYQDPRIVRVVAAKTEALGDQIKANVYTPTSADRKTEGAIRYALGALGKKDTFTVVDVGGALGAHYFVAENFILKDFPQTELSWRVVETDRMAEAGQNQFENGRLRFVNKLKKSVNASEEVDLVIASGSLQFFEDPLEMLAQILELRPSFVYIPRQALAVTFLGLGGQRIEVQRSKLIDNGPGELPQDLREEFTRSGEIDERVPYPRVLVLRRGFERVIRNEGYEILINEREGEALGYRNYFCRRIDLAQVSGIAA